MCKKKKKKKLEHSLHQLGARGKLLKAEQCCPRCNALRSERLRAMRGPAQLNLSSVPQPRKTPSRLVKGRFAEISCLDRIVTRKQPSNNGYTPTVNTQFFVCFLFQNFFWFSSTFMSVHTLFMCPPLRRCAQLVFFFFQIFLFLKFFYFSNFFIASLPFDLLCSSRYSRSCKVSRLRRFVREARINGIKGK